MKNVPQGESASALIDKRIKELEKKGLSIDKLVEAYLKKTETNGRSVEDLRGVKWGSGMKC